MGAEGRPVFGPGLLGTTAGQVGPEVVPPEVPAPPDEPALPVAPGGPPEVALEAVVPVLPAIVLPEVPLAPEVELPPAALEDPAIVEPVLAAPLEVAVLPVEPPDDAFDVAAVELVLPDVAEPVELAVVLLLEAPVLPDEVLAAAVVDAAEDAPRPVEEAAGGGEGWKQAASAQTRSSARGSERGGM